MRFLILFLLLIIGGCAVSAADCGPDWRAIGERDGVLGAQPQIERYAAKCGGVIPDAKRYDEGYRDGFGRRPRPTV